MTPSSQTSITGLVLVTHLGLSGCTPVVVDFSSICYQPLISTLVATPSVVYSSDTPSITATLYSPYSCLSSTYAVLTFPEDSSLDITPFPDYDASIEGLLLTPSNDTNPLTYTSSPLPLTSFSPGYVQYRITAVSGYPAQDHSSTLDDYFTLLSGDIDDTTSEYTADTGSTVDK